MNVRAQFSWLMMAVVVGVCCERSPVGAPGQSLRTGVVLLAELKSYSAPEAVRQIVGSKNWEVVFSPPRSSNDRRPRFDDVTVDAQTTFCGQSGVLRLHFINDLLVSTAFTPADFQECLKQLPNRDAFTLSGTSDESRYYWQNKGLDDKPFIAVADSRLQAEIDAWIRRYS
jgi:hypothetical protein